VARIATGYRDLINAVILRAVQDALGKRLAIESFTKRDREKAKSKIRKEAIEYISKDNDFSYMCECVDKDYIAIKSAVRRKINEQSCFNWKID
jgi:hypothetical protein